MGTADAMLPNLFPKDVRTSHDSLLQHLDGLFIGQFLEAIPDATLT